MAASKSKKPVYDPLSDDEDEAFGAGGGDSNDPFADPTDFLGSIGGGSKKSQGKERMECELRGGARSLRQIAKLPCDTGAAI